MTVDYDVLIMMITTMTMRMVVAVMMMMMAMMVMMLEDHQHRGEARRKWGTYRAVDLDLHLTFPPLGSSWPEGTKV